MYSLDASHEGQEHCARKPSADLWGTVQRVLPDARQLRLAFLLFHCGLRPREIVSHCSQEFGTVQEIARLRRTNFEQVLQKRAFQPETMSEEEQQPS